MLDTDKLDDLSRLYRLFSMVPEGLPTLKRAIRDSIVRRGKEINVSGVAADGGEVDEEDEDPRGKGKGKARATHSGAQTLQLALKWVEEVLALKDKFDAVWTRALRGDRELESGMNEVCVFPAPATTGI